MGTYVVAPSGNGWVVRKGGTGTVKSNHRKKSRAKSAARRMASSGDTVQIRRSNGTIQKSSTVR